MSYFSYGDDRLFESDHEDEYDDEDESDSNPSYSSCVVRCMACDGYGSFTDRNYKSEKKWVGREGDIFDIGEFCPVTECCHGPVCYFCAFRLEINCIFCRNPTAVCFLKKERDGVFSYQSNSSIVTKWLQKICDFDQFQKILGGNRHLFFSWLKTNAPKEFWDPKYFRWHNRLLYTPPITKSLICAFDKFLVATKMVVSQNFFCTVYGLTKKVNPIFGCIINERRAQMQRSFLEHCYSQQFSSSFKRKEMLKQFQIGFVGTLVVRLSKSRQNDHHYILSTIFSRIMLKLLISNN